MLAHMGRPQRIEPGPGQESVWDYPRPPALVATTSRLRVIVAGVTIADAVGGFRVLETSQPPAFYLPPESVDFTYLEATTNQSFCEWKGNAHYWTVTVGDDVRVDAAWSYPKPTAGFVAITDHLAFYPQRVDACFVDDEQVEPNEGSFYGGWITSSVVGPFKGGAGSSFW